MALCDAGAVEAGVHLPQLDLGTAPVSIERLVAVVDAARALGFAAVSANDATWAIRRERPRHVLDLLAADGSWIIVEPMAEDRVEDNFNPVGRAYYGFSTLLCTPASLSQDVGAAIDTQAGPAKVREVVVGAGFADCRTVAQTPFHRVLLATRT